MDAVREILIALPPTHGDIYRRHQLVWRAMQAHASHGRDFVFAAESDHLVRVRSACLDRGTISTVRDGMLRVDLVTAVRFGSKIEPVEHGDMAGWTEALLAQHGFRAQTIEVLRGDVARGRKAQRDTGATLMIALPVRTVQVDVRIEHHGKAALAWERGIGRGKRFGFGMLQAA